MKRVVPSLVLAVLVVGCASDQAPRGDPEFGVQLADSEPVVEFYERASAFYRRLTNRRVNSYATFNDKLLREYFQNEQAFSDYYAELAQSLVDGHIEQSRPLAAAVEEFLVDAPGMARVRVRLTGRNGLPLRPGMLHLLREDRWERTDGQWRIVPGKL